jgi:hypothetical protein
VITVGTFQQNTCAERVRCVLSHLEPILRDFIVGAADEPCQFAYVRRQKCLTTGERRAQPRNLALEERNRVGIKHGTPLPHLQYRLEQSPRFSRSTKTRPDQNRVASLERRTNPRQRPIGGGRFDGGSLRGRAGLLDGVRTMPILIVRRAREDDGASHAAQPPNEDTTSPALVRIRLDHGDGIRNRDSSTSVGAPSVPFACSPGRCRHDDGAAFAARQG